MGWDRECYSTVNAGGWQLEESFVAATGAALDAKLSEFSEEQQKALMADFGASGLLNMDAKKITAAVVKMEGGDEEEKKDEKPKPKKKE